MLSSLLCTVEPDVTRALLPINESLLDNVTAIIRSMSHLDSSIPLTG